MKYKIVIDSCGELLDRWKTDEKFESVPLTLTVGNEDIVDDESFNQAEFLEKVAQCPECPKSSCPSPEKYRQAFDCDAEHVYAITLSANLSGSYNSAVLGRNLLLEDKPEKKVYVFNSCSASAGETLIAMKIEECEEAGMEFEQIVETVEEYIQSQNIYFVLENLETLRKNGRLSNIKAFVASALKIKPVMNGTPEGTIVQLDQARGINKALVKMVDYVVENAKDSANKVLAITHCNCASRAEIVKEEILKRIEVKDVVVLDLTGCTVDEILYYVSNGYPVFAMTGSNDAVLVVGYDANNVVLYDPAMGQTYKRTIADADEMFFNAGNIFFTYQK